MGKTAPTRIDGEVITLKPNKGQAQVLQSKTRFIFACAGKRGGKTWIGALWAFQKMNTPNSRGLICANTHDQLRDSTLTALFDVFPHLKLCWLKRETKLNLPNGSVVFLRSLDSPNPIEGLTLDWIWADEADDMGWETWKILESRTTSTLGQILATTSIYPNGWIYDQVFKKQDPSYEIITWRTLDNPTFPPAEWERLRREMDPIEFDRVYGGEFVFTQGRVYDRILDYGMLESYPEGSEPVAVVFGIDFGIVDPTAIIVMTYNSDGCWYIVEEAYRPGMNIQEVNRYLNIFIERYGKPIVTAMDYAGGLARISLVNDARAVDAIKDIPGGVSMIRNLIFQQRLFCFKRCTNTVREFQNYSFDKRKDNMPEDKYNHALDAVRYVIQTTFQMVEGMVNTYHANHAPVEKLDNFWTAKKEQGIYIGNGKLQDKRVEFFNDDLEEGMW